MTVTEKSSATVDLAWLVDDLVHRVDGARHAIVLSADGLLVAASEAFNRDEAEHLSAVAAGLNSLARGAGRHFGSGGVRRTVIEMDDGFMFVTAAGRRACLAVLCDGDIDVGLVAYEIEMLVVRVGQFITTPPRGTLGAVGRA
jgi:predicted regulator of Ras-like GTPase activity (Roadblock/LC7/MglB family)